MLNSLVISKINIKLNSCNIKPISCILEMGVARDQFSNNQFIIAFLKRLATSIYSNSPFIKCNLEGFAWFGSDIIK